MKVSFAVIEPPLLKPGETQATRPTTSDTMVAFSPRFTVPVNSTANV